MKPPRFLTDSSLSFHARDAAEAIAALPTGPNAERYLAEHRACVAELQERERKRGLRRTAREFLADPLALPFPKRSRYRRNVIPQHWRETHRVALFTLFFRK